MAIEWNPHWFDIPGPVVDDPPLWGPQRELWLEFADRFFYTGEMYVESIPDWVVALYKAAGKWEDFKEFCIGKGVFYSSYLNLMVFGQRVAFNVPIGEPEEVSGVSGSTLKFYQSLTGLRIPVLIDTIGFWGIPGIDLLLKAMGEWWALLLDLIPKGYPDWGWSWFTFNEVLTSSAWGRWKAIYYWLDQYKETTGREPFIQVSKMVCRWPDPHVAVAAGDRWYTGTIWKPEAPDPVAVLTEDYDWPTWYYRF